MTDYIPSTSRQLNSLNRAWVSVTYQSGRSVLDSELNLTQNISQLRKRISLPSGILSSYPPRDPNEDFVFYTPDEVDFLPNTLHLQAFVAHVAGYEIYVGGTQSEDPTLNIISLPSPTAASGTPPDPNTLNFVFLEVWKALVTPSSSATAYLRVISNENLSEGDTITLDGSSLGGDTITLEAGVDFDIGITAPATARNIRDAINSISTLGVSVTADTKGTEFVFLTFDGGADANSVTLSTSLSTLGTIVVSQPVGGTDGEGQPTPDKIYFEGNTLSDESLFLDEDIRDSEVGVETTKRVQLQYRIRVFENIDTSEVYGFENQDILAQGGGNTPVTGFYFSRADGISVTRLDGGVNAYPYVDNGLFICGDGSSTAASALSSVDGYVYAIPLCIVARRTEGSFDPELAANNGLLSTHTGVINTALTAGESFAIAPNTSDRPDGLFSDQVADVDVLDLRRFVFPQGVDFSSELERQFQLLLDNRNKTWLMKGSDYEPIASSSGDVSHAPLVCNEIGRSSDRGGTGDTSVRGRYIREFDHLATRFSDISVLERLVIELFPDGDETYGGAVSITKIGGSSNWYEGDEIVIDISQLDVSTSYRYWDTPSSAGDYLSDLLPEGAKIIDVVEAYHDEGHTLMPVSQDVYWSTVEGLGTNSVTLTLDRNQTTVNGGLAANPDYKMVGDTSVGDTGSPRRIFLKLLVEYPSGLGLSATPTGDALSPNATIAYPTGGAVLELDSSQRDPEALIPPVVAFREGIREVVLESVKDRVTDYYVSSQGGFVRVPYRVYDDETGDYTPIVYDEVADAEITLSFEYSKLGSTDTQLAFQFPVIGQRLLRVEYNPKVPIADYGANGYQVGVYYRSRSPQTTGAKIAPINTLVPSTLKIKPIKVSDKLWVIQGGSASSDDLYPYLCPSEQIGVHPNIFEYQEEGSLQTPPFIQLSDFSITTGLISLPVMLPMDGTGGITLTTPDLDNEGRVVFKQTATGEYKPSAYAKNLDDLAAHKNALPMLARVVEGNDLFRKGEIVLVVITRLSERPDLVVGSEKNQVLFSPSEDRTVACVYRTQNLLLGAE